MLRRVWGRSIGFTHRGATLGRARRTPGARDDQYEPRRRARSERLPEQRDAGEQRDGWVHVGDHRCAHRPDLRDQSEEEQKRHRRAGDSEHRDRADHGGRRHRRRELGDPYGGVDERAEPDRDRHHVEGGKIGKAPRNDERAESVPGHDQRHFHDGGNVSAEVEPEERYDAGEPRSEAGKPSRAQWLVGARQPGEEGAQQWDRGHEQPREGAADAPLGVGEQPPRKGDFDQGEEKDRSPARQERAQVAIPQHRGQQKQRAEASAQEHEARGQQFPDRDLDQEIRDPPDHRQRQEEQPTSACHRELLLEDGRSRWHEGWPGGANDSGHLTPIARLAGTVEELADGLDHEIVIVLLREARHRDRADEAGVLHEYAEAAAVCRECLRRNSQPLGERLSLGREVEPHGLRAAEHALDQVLLALDPRRVVRRCPRGGEVEQALSAALHVDGDGELPRARLLHQEEPELEGVVVRAPVEDERPLLGGYPLPFLIEVRRHRPASLRQGRRNQNRRNGDSASRIAIACMVSRSLCCPPARGTSWAGGNRRASRSPIVKGTTSSSVPWTISTGSAIAGAFDSVSNGCRTKAAGKNGNMRRAISTTEVNGEMRTSRAPRPRFAISEATPVPSDWPRRTTRSGPICRSERSQSRALSAAAYAPRSDGLPPATP